MSRTTNQIGALGASFRTMITRARKIMPTTKMTRPNLWKWPYNAIKLLGFSLASASITATTEAIAANRPAWEAAPYPRCGAQTTCAP